MPWFAGVEGIPRLSVLEAQSGLSSLGRFASLTQVVVRAIFAKAVSNVSWVRATFSTDGDQGIAAQRGVECSRRVEYIPSVVGCRRRGRMPHVIASQLAAKKTRRSNWDSEFRSRGETNSTSICRLN